MKLWSVTPTPLAQDKFLGEYLRKYKSGAEKALQEEWPLFVYQRFTSAQWVSVTEYQPMEKRSHIEVSPG